MNAQPRTLEQLHNRRTTYEIVADLPGGQVRLGFLARVSRTSLIKLARQHADEILPHLTDDDQVSYTAGRLVLGADVVIRKTGRTERECTIEETGTL